MKTTFRAFGWMLILAALSFGQLTTWSGNYVSVSYASVPYTTHGIASAMLGVAAFTSGGTEVPVSEMSYTINATTYEVDVSFGVSFTGTLYIQGPYPAASSAPNGFDVHIGSNTNKLWVCPSCDTTAVIRCWNGQLYGSGAHSTLVWPTSDTTESPTAYVYLNGNRVTYGLSMSCCVTGLTAVNADIVMPVTAMPSGSGIVPLGQSTVSNAAWGTVTDLRPPDDSPYDCTNP